MKFYGLTTSLEVCLNSRMKKALLPMTFALDFVAVRLDLIEVLP